MKISELKRHLKEVKKIVPYKDGETEICIPNHYIGCFESSMELFTEIDGYKISVRRGYKEKK